MGDIRNTRHLSPDFVPMSESEAERFLVESLNNSNVVLDPGDIVKDSSTEEFEDILYGINEENILVIDGKVITNIKELNALSGGDEDFDFFADVQE